MELLLLPDERLLSVLVESVDSVLLSVSVSSPSVSTSKGASLAESLESTTEGGELAISFPVPLGPLGTGASERS